MSKTFTCILNCKSKFDLCRTSLKDLWWFLGGFWGANIVKSENNLKNIRKSPNNILNIILSKILFYTLKDARRFRLTNAYKKVFGIFFILFRSWVIDKPGFCECVEIKFFFFFFFLANSSKQTKKEIPNILL